MLSGYGKAAFGRRPFLSVSCIWMMLNFVRAYNLAPESNFAVSAEANDVEDFLANVDADRGQGRYGGIHGLLLRVLRCSP